MWISIDPASKSGWAMWDGDKLFKSGTIRAMGKAGKWIIECYDLSRVVYENECHAWSSLLCLPDMLVLEHGRGEHRNADSSLAERRGYIRAIAETNGCMYNEVTNAEWRRIVKEQTGLSWPTGASKDHSLKLCKDLMGLECETADESDALLIGWSWIKSGRVAS
jgi:hypothetical protein